MHDKWAVTEIKRFEYIFFDGMETIIDLHKLPNMRDYAAWSYFGSGLEDNWDDFDDYFRYYMLAKQEMAERLPEHAEYEMRQRFIYIIEQSNRDMPFGLMEWAADRLYRNYCRNYYSGSFIHDDVLETLQQLKQEYKLGIVSNFMVMNGIEEMLEMHQIKGLFDFIITSVAEGWKKPHQRIYEKALKVSGTGADKVVFVGDDYINDYITPKRLGMSAVLLDRYNKHPDVQERVSSFYELKEMLDKVD